MSRYMAGILALVREKMKDELTSDLQDLALEDGELIGHIQTALDEISRAVPKKNSSLLSVYAAPDDDYIVDAASIAAWTAGSTATRTNSTLTPARNLTIKVTDANYSITALTLTVVGTMLGAAQTEIFYLAGGLIQEGTKLFETITSVTGTAITGNGAADTLDVGFGKMVYNGLSLPEVGPTSYLDLSACRDKYGMAYFKNILGVPGVEYPVNTATSGKRNRRNSTLSGDILELWYDSEITTSYQVRIDWDSKYNLDFTSTNVPEYLEEILIAGATASAFIALGDSKVNTVTLGAAVSGQFKDTGLTKMQLFKRDLANQIPPTINKSYSRS